MIRPTESELEILQVLWSEGPCTVRLVHEKLNGDRQKEVGYTTTLKLMQIMLEKGLLVRDESQRTHIYRALVEESAIRQGLLQRFVDTAFRGSASQLMIELLGQQQTDAQELEAIRQLIDRIEQEGDRSADYEK